MPVLAWFAVKAMNSAVRRRELDFGPAGPQSAGLDWLKSPNESINKVKMSWLCPVDVSPHALKITSLACQLRVIGLSFFIRESRIAAFFSPPVEPLSVSGCMI